MPADALVVNARNGYSIEEIVTDLFPTVPLDRARRILNFAGLDDPRGG